jgi:hypothetical protein
MDSTMLCVKGHPYSVQEFLFGKIHQCNQTGKKSHEKGEKYMKNLISEI